MGRRVGRLGTSLLHDDITEERISRSPRREVSQISLLCCEIGNSSGHWLKQSSQNRWANRIWRGGFSSPYPDENTEAESVRLELGVDVNAGLPRQKPWWIVMVSQIPKLVLKVDHAEVQPPVLMVIDAAAKLVNNAVVGLTRSVRNVTGADHKIAVR